MPRPVDAGAEGALCNRPVFQDVKIRQDGGRLVVSVVESPVINRIAIEGNHKAKDEQLLGEIQSKTARHLLARQRPDPTSSALLKSISAAAAVTTCAVDP